MAKKYDLTIKEASARLGVSVSTIRRLIKRGQLSKRYEKVGRSRIIKLSSAEVDQIKSDRGQVKQTVSLDQYSELEKRYNELQKRHEALVYQYGATESRLKELEAEAESLRIKAKKGIFDRIKDWWRGER